MLTLSQNTPIADKVLILSDVQLAKILGGLILVDVVLLSTWTWLSPTPGSISSVVMLTANFVGRQRACSGGNVIGVALLFTYKGLMLLYAAYLSFRTRHAPSDFSEQRFVTTAIVVMGFSAVVILPLIYTIDTNKVLIASLGVIFVTASSIGIYTIPKVFKSYDIAHFGLTAPSTDVTLTRHTSPRVHVGARSLPLQSSMQSNDYEIECPECGHKFEM